MKRSSIIAAIATACVLNLAGQAALAQAPSDQPTSDQVMRSVVQGCQQDMQRFCSSVTPGGNRMLACIYAHRDQISANCLQSLYNNAPHLQRAIMAMNNVASACQAELQTRCANVPPGSGRVERCLRNAESQLSAGCREALQNMPADE